MLVLAILALVGGAIAVVALQNQSVAALLNQQPPGAILTATLTATLLAIIISAAITLLTARRRSRRLSEVIPASDQIAAAAVNRDLEHHVRARTAELEKALHAAEAAARAKTDFLANMSHEIRTPMTAILGFADLLAAPECPPDERDEHVRTIKRNGEHLLVIVNDILDISKMEAGKMTAHLTPCHPLQVVEEVRSLLARKAADAGIALRAEFPTGPLPNWVSSEPTRLRQILTNLVANALKFTKAGSVTISASVTNAGLTTQGLCFAVSDTGSGMDAEQLSRLFLPFSQVGNSASRVHGGTGLGLAISRGLAKMLGGGITVKSEPGKGSVFTVTVLAPNCPPPPAFGERRKPCEDLARSCAQAEQITPDRPPIATAAEHRSTGTQFTTQTPNPVSPAATASSPSGPARALRSSVKHNGMRVLLAEDGADNQRLIALHLRRAGFTVEIVENGQLALDAITARPTEFDVLISDMQMPVMDGYTAVRALRAQGYLGPVLALTAHAMNGDRERCLAAGCDDYATKPIQATELIAKVSAMAAVSRAIASGQRTPRHYDKLVS